MTGALPDLDRYGLVVFDLDGTLYRQGPVRRRMLARLVTARGTPGRITRLRLLRRFRHLREIAARTDPRAFDAPLFARLARDTGRDEAMLRDLVRDWMEHRPLPLLHRARVAGAADLFARLRRNGTNIAVWSDYPVIEKLAALSLTADHALWAGDAGVGALKPDPAGLRSLMERTGTIPARTLMVGDRLSHDGAAAKSAGVDFLLRASRAPAVLAEGQYHVTDFRALAARL